MRRRRGDRLTLPHLSHRCGMLMLNIERWTLNVRVNVDLELKIFSSPLKLRRHVTLLNSQHGNSLFFIPTTSMRCPASKHPSSLTTLLITARYQAAEGHKDARWAPTVPIPLARWPSISNPTRWMLQNGVNDFANDRCERGSSVSNTVYVSALTTCFTDWPTFFFLRCLFLTVEEDNVVPHYSPLFWHSIRQCRHLIQDLRDRLPWRCAMSTDMLLRLTMTTSFPAQVSKHPTPLPPPESPFWHCNRCLIDDDNVLNDCDDFHPLLSPDAATRSSSTTSDHKTYEWLEDLLKEALCMPIPCPHRRRRFRTIVHTHLQRIWWNNGLTCGST